MTAAEIVGSLLGVIAVALMIRQHLLAWPLGMIQVVVYGWIFYQAKLYSDTLLQGFFFVILGYGWWRWWRGEVDGQVRTELPVTRLSNRGRWGYLALGALATFGWGALMDFKTDAVLPYWDAFILAFSLLSQWLQARKRLENWIGWTVVNSVAVGVYLSRELYVTAVLYALFLGMAIAGWRSWRKSFLSVSS